MDEALWALGRGSGITALVLMTVTTVLGIITRSGRPMLSLPRFGIQELHRTTALLASVFVIVHIVSLLGDPYAQLDVVDFVIPFLGEYRSLWLGLGTLAVDITVAIVVTALLRHRLGHRVFRLVHWFAYAMWPIAVAHGLGIGTDRTQWWFLALTVLNVSAVGAAAVWRLSANFTEHRTRTKVLV